MENKNMTTEESYTEYELSNKAHNIVSCTMTIFNDGKILLNWRLVLEGGIESGEDGFFATQRALKMYVTKKGISNGSAKFNLTTPQRDK